MGSALESETVCRTGVQRRREFPGDRLSVDGREMKKLLVILAFGVLAVSPLLISQEKKPSAFSPYVDADGAIRRPKEYRDEWTHLGTYMVLNESGAGHG